MTTYGLNNGTIPFTGYTGTLGVGSALTGAASGTTLYNKLSQSDRAIMQRMRKLGNRKLRNKFRALIVGDTGTTVTNSIFRVQGPTDPNLIGGLSLMKSFDTSITATAADKTALTALLLLQQGAYTYVADASGNGRGQLRA